jgi:hypothetical protein
MLNLDQVLILFDIFGEMEIEKMPFELSAKDKENMQIELRKAYKIKNSDEQEAEIKSIQTKYGVDVLPSIIKFIIGNLGKAKLSVKEFIACYKGISIDEASKLGIKDISKIIFEIKDEIVEAVKDFLSQK